MKFNIAVCLLGLLTAADVSAGAASVKLDCKATNAGGSGITLSGWVPGDFDEFDLTLANRNGSLNWSLGDGAAHTIIALDRKVFTLALVLNDGHTLELYALPSSVKHKGQRSRMFEASFDAVLEHAPRPGYKAGGNQDAYVRNVPMRCEASHSV